MASFILSADRGAGIPGFGANNQNRTSQFCSHNRKRINEEKERSDLIVFSQGSCSIWPQDYFGACLTDKIMFLMETVHIRIDDEYCLFSASAFLRVRQVSFDFSK